MEPTSAWRVPSAAPTHEPEIPIGQRNPLEAAYTEALLAADLLRRVRAAGEGSSPAATRRVAAGWTESEESDCAAASESGWSTWTRKAGLRAGGPRGRAALALVPLPREDTAEARDGDATSSAMRLTVARPAIVGDGPAHALVLGGGEQAGSAPAGHRRDEDTRATPSGHRPLGIGITDMTRRISKWRGAAILRKSRVHSFVAYGYGGTEEGAHASSTGALVDNEDILERARQAGVGSEARDAVTKAWRSLPTFQVSTDSVYSAASTVPSDVGKDDDQHGKAACYSVFPRRRRLCREPVGGVPA
jgi:hypothetical protein